MNNAGDAVDGKCGFLVHSIQQIGGLKADRSNTPLIKEDLAAVDYAAENKRVRESESERKGRERETEREREREERKSQATKA